MYTDLLTDFSIRLLERLPINLSGLQGAPIALEKLRAHGTTIGALRINNGEAAIAFSDGKVSVMDQALGKKMDKVLQTDTYSCLLVSGSAAMGLELGRILRTWTEVHENCGQRLQLAAEKVNFIVSMLKRNLPMAAHGMGVMPLFVTYDAANTKEARIYLFSVDGAYMLREYSSVIGSGFVTGNSLLEDIYEKELRRVGSIGVEQGIALAREVLAKTTVDDNASGGSWTIKLIDKSGVRRIGEE